MWEDVPLYQALVQRLLHAQLGGATAVAGLTGFGRHHRLHQKRLFAMPDDRPIVVMAVDEEAKIRAVLPSVTGMVREGLVLLLDAEVVSAGHVSSLDPEEPTGR